MTQDHGTLTDRAAKGAYSGEFRSGVAARGLPPRGEEADQGQVLHRQGRVADPDGEDEQEVREEVRKKLEQRGRERALLYKTAVYTGLRLGEIASLRPCHLELNKKHFPRVEIPGKMTKNSQQARLLLVPSFAEELAAWIAETGKGSDEPLFHVPQASVRIMQADLKLAESPTGPRRATPTSTHCG